MLSKTELMYRIAELYYMDELKQESIARRLNISKYKVSRMLKKAKEKGVIQIKIIRSDDNKN